MEDGGHLVRSTEKGIRKCKKQGFVSFSLAAVSEDMDCAKGPFFLQAPYKLPFFEKAMIILWISSVEFALHAGTSRVESLNTKPRWPFLWCGPSSRLLFP
jgi:hypothetical protein